MKPTVCYEDIRAAQKKRTIGFVDVRSPKEYQHATIPGAVNIPVLDNEAREKIGTLYVNGHVNEAKRCGVAWCSEHLPDMYDQYQQLLNRYDELVLFCSRGGMRSNTIFSLLKALGMPVSRLDGGYKAYRRYIVQHLDHQLTQVNYITLYGLSGSGKTEILNELQQLGLKTLDLEGCANHRGSLLGGIGLSTPHSQKMFESLLFESSKAWEPGDTVFTEGESKRIGKAMIPVSLFSAIQTGEKLFIDASLNKRIAQIRQDYTQTASTQELIEALENMNKVINPERVEAFKKQLSAGKLDAVIEKLLTAYYDPKYNHHKKDYCHTFTNHNALQTAKEIAEWQAGRIQA